MNDLMSGGMHRLLEAVHAGARRRAAGRRRCSTPTGSGDLALGHAHRLRGSGQLVASDINERMPRAVLAIALIDAGVGLAIDYVQADAQALPFAERRFDCITIGFGLRSVTRPARRALAEMARERRRRRATGDPGILRVAAGESGSGKAYDAHSFRRAAAGASANGVAG
ncbi:MAG: class I SAM-dependent methyltransferase [Halofilum sp. (in: g-proteobacteria)]|nr:class I SAM-dependent methyltransferase [Halofilum sp. (in: g-proteobacteria)]